MSVRINAAFRLLAAAWWDRMTKEQQNRYLQTHPRSRKKVIDNGSTPANPPKEAPKKEAPKKEAPKKEAPKKEAPKKEAPKPADKPQKSAPKPEQPTGKVAKGKAAHKAATADLTPQQTQAIKEYTGSMYRTVNPKLRDGKPVSKADMKDVKLMDQAFDGAKTKEPIEVYRGLGETDRDLFANIKVGQSFMDHGFVSTSTDKDTAFNFARGDTPTVMRVQVPTGSKAISVDALSAFKKSGYVTRSENEILLNRGGSYKVVSITPGKGKRVPRVITVEYSD
jgi:hypothetical protein